MRYIWRIITQSHEQDENIQRIEFEHLSIQTKTKTDLHIDGDPQEKSKNIEIMVKKQALKVLIPPNASAHLI